MTTSFDPCLTEVSGVFIPTLTHQIPLRTLSVSDEDQNCSERELDYSVSDVVQTYSYVDENHGGVEEEQEEGNQIEAMDFEFVDSSCYYSPFEIADEIEKPDYEDGESNCMLQSAMKRMKYERKFSASLYAFNGISECLKFKVDSVKGRSEHLSKLRNACNNKNREEESRRTEENSDELMKPSSSSNDGDLSLWSSLDLPPICIVN
jgi:EREBP-like factor